MSSTAAIAAAAPPPMPLKRAIICGMPVMGTRRPDHWASAMPTAIAPTMRRRWCMPGVKKVATAATVMPTPAQTMPRRAVAGELMLRRPAMNRTAVAK